MADNKVTIFPDEQADLKTWANQLLIDFNAESYIPSLDDPDNWKKWGNIVATNNIFSRADVPTTDQYDDWREWAKLVYSTL